MGKQEYIKANREWLENKSKEAGVLPLPKGIYYKVLKQGDMKSAQPTPRSIVTAHYTGWTINGKKFDSSRGGVPFACRLCDLIEGWIIAMQQMHIGDKWEIYGNRPTIFITCHRNICRHDFIPSRLLILICF